MSGEQTKPTEAELRELAARGAADLGGANATELLQWTEENFAGVNGPRGRTMCNYVVACHYGERRQYTDTPYRNPAHHPSSPTNRRHFGIAVACIQLDVRAVRAFAGR